MRDLPDVDRREYITVIRMSLEDQGWGGQWAEDIADAMVDLASSLPTDAVNERRSDPIQVRRAGRGVATLERWAT